MISRTSHVKRIIMKNTVFSSNFQIGDAEYIDATADVLALEHNKQALSSEEVAVWDEETDFSYKAPCPAINETVHMTVFNDNPKICVNNIEVIAISTAAIFQVGNTSHIRMVSSVFYKEKNIQTNI